MGKIGILYLLQALPGEHDIGAGHLHEVTFFASTLAIAYVLAHLRSVINVRDIFRDGVETTAKILDLPIGNLEEEE